MLLRTTYPIQTLGVGVTVSRLYSRPRDRSWRRRHSLERLRWNGVILIELMNVPELVWFRVAIGAFALYRSVEMMVKRVLYGFTSWRKPSEMTRAALLVAIRRPRRVPPYTQ